MGFKFINLNELLFKNILFFIIKRITRLLDN